VKSVAPLQRTTTVDTLAAAIRARILDGELEPGASLREQHLAADYAVARHTVRAALRALANEGLVRIETHRGAHVTELTSADVEALAELRIALETEAARLALIRGAGRLPDPVHRAQAQLAGAARRQGGFAAITDAHEALHHAIVHAAASPRIEAAHAALAGELRLFLTRLRPVYNGATLAAEHAALLDDLEHGIGPEALRTHIETSTQTLLSAMR